MKRFKSIVAAALVVMIAAASAMPALPVSAASSAALSIVPKKNYIIKPGKSVKDTLTIHNLDDAKPLNLSLRVVDFTFTDDGGTPKLMLGKDAPQTTWSLKPFLTVPKSVSIPPKETKTVDMSVAIPEGHGAGSYYSAIVYSSGASDGGNVGLSASGVTLVFTSIPGDVKEDLKLEKFGTYKQASTGKEAGYTFMSMQEPLSVAYTLKNSGNVTESPVGSITLKHMFGKEYVIHEVNPNESLALIGQSRTFVSCIKLKSEKVDFHGSRSEADACTSAGLWPGYYNMSLHLFYGQNGNRTQEVIGAGSFWYLPAWFLAVVFVVLAIIAYFVWRIVRFIRRKVYGIQPKKSQNQK